MRHLVLILLVFACCACVHGRNYIRYHQQALLVQEHLLRGEHRKALQLLSKLDKHYGLMPPDMFTRARCQAMVGDTAAARRSYLMSLERRASIGWLYIEPPTHRSATDSLWYEGVVAECLAYWRSRPQYADGPNPGMPTAVTWANTRHQFVIDSLGSYDPVTQPEAQRAYDEVVRQHDQLLDSILTGKLPVPSIATYGSMDEFETFVLHCSSTLTNGREKHFKKWLKQGLIFPRTYAICFDDLANETRRPIPYGYFNGLRPEELAPGHEKRRAAIGMGDDRMDKLRFHWGG